MTTPADKKVPVRDRAWVLFDHVVGQAANGRNINPWVKDPATGLTNYEPDFVTLKTLLGIPLALKAASTSGVPALALDVWTAYELRRAGFAPDAVWPRAVAPRILPSTISQFLAAGNQKEVRALETMISSGKTYGGAFSASANILGKNYVKQVDVVISAWHTGPELMISTKRMDSSFGKNAANRVEESYGDAKNLRSRHPQAALGFLYCLRSTALTEAPAITAWLIDLLGKLGREDDAYDAVALIIPDWTEALDDQLESLETTADDSDDGEDPLVAAGVIPPAENAEQVGAAIQAVPEDLNQFLESVPDVDLLQDAVPPLLKPERFLSVMISRILDNTPVTYHPEARRRRDNPRSLEVT